MRRHFCRALGGKPFRLHFERENSSQPKTEIIFEQNKFLSVHFKTGYVLLDDQYLL